MTQSGRSASESKGRQKGHVMRYAILGLILLMGCTRDLPPLGWDSLWRQGMSGEQWLQYDLEKRRAAALELRETLISRRGNFIKSTAVFLVYELQSLEQEIKEYECIDQPQEACDQEEAALSRRLAGICERLGADDCSADGIFPAGDALVERYLRKTIDAYICAYQIETLDRVARADPESPVLSAALESCGLIMPIVITSTMSALGRKRTLKTPVFGDLNVRFREKRTFSRRRAKSGRWVIALPPKADTLTKEKGLQLKAF